MDKQKQIEEMAKELCPHYDNGNCYYEVTEVCECCFGCEFCWAISQVLNAGYRKQSETAKDILKLVKENNNGYEGDMDRLEKAISERYGVEVE